MRDTKYHLVIVIASISKNLQVTSVNVAHWSGGEESGGVEGRREGEGRGGDRRGVEGKGGEREHTQNIGSR